MEKQNTPFSPIQSSAAPTRRLWNFLVRQELVQDIFIRAVFGKKRVPSTMPEPNSVAPSVAGDLGTPVGGGNKMLEYNLFLNINFCYLFCRWR